MPGWEGAYAWFELQLPAEMLAQWDAHWATPVKEAMTCARNAVCGRIKALLAECIAGRPAIIDSVTVTKSLACLPENHTVARFLAMCFDAVIAYTSALGSGSLASVVQITTAKQKLHRVMEAWPQKGRWRVA